MKAYGHGTSAGMVIGLATVSDAYIVGQITVNAQKLVLPSGLVIDEVALHGDDVTIEPAKTPKTNEPAQVTVRISAESIREHLERKSPDGLSDFEVLADAGVVTIAATARIVFPIRTTVVCTLELTEKTVSVNVQSVEPGAARPIVEKQIASVNPILDLNKFPFDVTVCEVDVQNGSVTLTGKLVL